MKRKNPYALFLFIPVLFSLLFFTPPQSALAALSIYSITPGTISNTQTNFITVTGTDFQAGAVVSLNTVGNLNTSYFSSTTLIAEVSSGTPTGIYSLTVTNPDLSTVTLAEALTIVDQPIAPTPTNTIQSSGYERPVVVILNYSPNNDQISPGEDFSLSLTLYNSGQNYATNVVATFVPGMIIPRGTGGVISVGDIAPGNRDTISQALVISTDFWGTLATGEVNISYTDQAGVSYSESFTIAISVYYSYSPSAPTPTITPTVTPAPSFRPQLVITSYDPDPIPLQPGAQFTLTLGITNTGNATARRVTMIVGGGSASSSGNGTPDPGGISGASGEFTNFAPIGSSNLQTLGDINAAASLTASQTLIVNVTTSPGAYPMRISFVYVDEHNNPYIDEQIITLLVYRQPNIDLSFYRDPGPLYAGQDNILPIQVVNLGRNSVVLGNLQVNTLNGQMSNNTILVGALETGGYFTLDAAFFPEQPGTYELEVSIDYTDDFNQPQVISRTITVEVIEMYIPEPETNGYIDGESGFVPEPETFLQKIWRVILGLIGLDSSLKTSNSVVIDEYYEPESQEAIPVPPLKGP